MSSMPELSDQAPEPVDRFGLEAIERPEQLLDRPRVATDEELDTAIELPHEVEQ